MQTLRSGFRLCDSVLYENTRDVYGQQLPVGNWKYTLTHDGQDDIRLEIKALNKSFSKWSPLRVNRRPYSVNETEGHFTTDSEGEIKFIFSTTTEQRKVRYRCEVSPA